jgi:hypothetical protein
MSLAFVRLSGILEGRCSSRSGLLVSFKSVLKAVEATAVTFVVKT